jgi:hypothetical protein
VTEITDQPDGLIPIRVRVTAPADSDIILVLTPRQGRGMLADSRRLLAGLRSTSPSRCDAPEAGGARPFLQMCSIGSHETVSSDLSLVTVVYAQDGAPFGVKRPVRVVPDPDKVLLRIRHGLDTTFHVAVRLERTKIDFDESRYGLDMTWYSIHESNSDLRSAIDRSVYERAHFSHINYRLFPLWVALAGVVLHTATFR